MYKHSSQVSCKDVRPGNLTPDTAQKIAECFNLDAFLDIENSDWYMFDRDSKDVIHLSQQVYLKLYKVCNQKL